MSTPAELFFEHEAVSYGGQFLPRKTGRNALFRARLALARELAQNYRGSMLDCATGTGEISAAILDSGRFSTATLVDISSEMLRRAQARVPSAPGQEIRFIHTDVFDFLRTLEPSIRFDLIICLGLIAHAGRLELLLRAFGDHLAPDGRILLQTSLLEHPGNWLWRLLLDKRATKRHGYSFSYYTDEQIRRATDQAELSVNCVRRYGLGVPLLEKIWPWANYHLEQHFSDWASRKGAEAIYTLSKTASGRKSNGADTSDR